MRGALLAAMGLVIGLTCGYLVGVRQVPAVNPQLRELNADVWVQTSAEYTACCLQTYQLAAATLRAKLSNPARPKDKPPAVAMDLDETVLDNSPFQTFLFRNRLGWSEDLWKAWEADCAADVRLVPGAFDFIREAERLGVTVVYISNRKDVEGAVKAVEHVKLDTKDIRDRLLLLTTKSSDKTARRDQVRERYQLLMLFGDNLCDFSEEFRAAKVDPADVAGLKAAIAARREKVEKERAKWGEEWVILPNPVYGEWPKLEGNQPVEVLNASTKMRR